MNRSKKTEDANLKLVSKLLLDKETRAMKKLSNEAAALDKQRRQLALKIAQIQADCDRTFADKKSALQYLDALKRRLAGLNAARQNMSGNEAAQKERLKSALTAEMRLNEKP